MSSTELPPLKTNTLDGTCPNGQMSTPSAVTSTPTSTSSVSTTSATSTTRETAKATAVTHSASTAADRVAPTASDFTGSGLFSTEIPPFTSLETEQYMTSSTTDSSVKEPSQGFSSTVWIAVGAGAGCVVLLIVTVIVVCVVVTRRRKGNVTVYQNEMIGYTF